MSTIRAARGLWQTNEMPEKRSLFEFRRHFSPPEFALVNLGKVPERMEDKWFIFFEEPWVFFHRSWTGDCIFKLRLEPDDIGYNVAEAWVNRDRQQYASAGTTSDIEWLSVVIEKVVLKNP